MPTLGVYKAMEMTYADIVKGCLHHNPKAQRALYDDLAPMAMGVCSRYAMSRDEAHDLLQDGFVKVYEKIGTLRNPDKLRSWVYNIMVNTCIQCYRKRQHETLMEDMDVFDDPEEMPAFTTGEVMAALQRLTPSQRMAFNLCCIEDRSYDEAAGEMRCSNVNVRALVCHARSRMRTILEQINK